MSNAQTNAPIAVALIRVSTTDQADSRLGLEGQRAAIEAFALAQGLTVVQWIAETGSGGTPLADRPGLLDALGAVADHGAAHLLVSCHDRLARSVLTAELVHSELSRSGATLLSADGAGNDQSAESRMIRTILGAVAEFERAKIALRTRAALRAKRGRGDKLGPAFLGSGPESERRALDRLAALVERGDLTQDALAALLAREGFTTRRGRPVDRAWVARALRQASPAV